MRPFLDPSERIPIPADVAVCPICGDALVGEIDEWELDNDGFMMVSECGLELTCVSEPENIAEKEWRDWNLVHYQAPYESWHHLTPRVIKWINENYRFTNGRCPTTKEELRHWFVKEDGTGQWP